MRAAITLVAIPLVISSFIRVRRRNHGTATLRSTTDGRFYQVRKDVDNPELSVETLAELRRRIDVLVRHLNPQENPYHRRLKQRIAKTVIRENPLRKPPSTMTSYSINKGEEVVMCLRNPQTGGLHDIDTLMYVVLHEVAHIACPEVGHTKLFVEIFSDLLRIASKIQVIRKTDYKTVPVHYCGMTISERLV